MSENEEEKRNTVQKLLDSAKLMFGKNGFRDTTVKEICEEAGVNIASVNYHFGSKEELYTEAWRQEFQKSIEAHPPDGGVPEDAPPEERFRGRVKSLIRRIADKDKTDFLFMFKEMANPTSLMKEVKRECIQPLRESLMSVIRELLGPEASEREVLYCERSVVSQCFYIMRMRQERESMEDEEEADRGENDSDTLFPEVSDIEAFADHVCHFSLSGMGVATHQ